MSWKASTIAANAAQQMQVDAGTLLKRFDINNVVAPVDADIIAATTGDFNISEQPEYTDFLEDVNNAPNGTKDGARITSWTRSLTVSIIEFTSETIKLALGSAQDLANGGVGAKRQVSLSDFKDIWWIGDMVNENKILAIHLKDSISTGGLSMTTTKNGKGNISLTITPHPTLADIEASPIEYYILEKDDETRNNNVEQILSHVTSDYTGGSILTGGELEVTLTAENDYTISNVTVLMGGEDVTSSAWNSGTGKVTIASVSGDVVIMAIASGEGA